MNNTVSIANFSNPEGADSGALVSNYADSMGSKIIKITSKSNEYFHNFNYGDIDWRKNLQNIHWLIISSTTVLEGLSPKNAWAASMTFGELEGSKTVMIVDVPKDINLLPEMWGAVIGKIRQINILYMTSDAIKYIAKLENIETNNLLNNIRIKGIVPIVCTYDEKSKEATIIHSRGSLNVTLESNIPYQKWIANFLNMLPLQSLDNEGIYIAAKYSD